VRIEFSLIGNARKLAKHTSVRSVDRMPLFVPGEFPANHLAEAEVLANETYNN